MKTGMDWTNGPAKWGAALLLGIASVGGMAWSLSGNRTPVTVTKAPAQPRPAPIHEPTTAPPPQTAATPELVKPAPEPTPAPVVPPAAGRRINLNTATQAELELLPGIGPAMAKRILEYRTSRGKFTSVDQLDGVKGIGDKTMAKLRPLVSVD